MSIGCSWNVQFFATTHSAECIDAAIEAFENAPEDLSLHNLFRNKGEITGKSRRRLSSGEHSRVRAIFMMEMRSRCLHQKHLRELPYQDTPGQGCCW